MTDTQPELFGWHREEYDDYAKILRRDVDKEVNPRRQLTAYTSLVTGVPPAVQQALAFLLRSLAPEAFGLLRADCPVWLKTSLKPILESE